MLWDVLILVFVVLTLGVAFGAVPLGDVVRGRRLLRRSPVPDEAPAVMPDAKEADVIPFPAVRPDGTGESDEIAAARARHA